MLTVFLKAVFAFQRRRARQLGYPESGCGAVTFVQRFNSALGLNIHYHSVIPDGLFEKENGEFHRLPPPDEEEVSEVLAKVARRVLRLLHRRGLLEDNSFPENALESCQAASLQQKFLPLLLSVSPPKRAPRSAFWEGFSLHANTRVHENDRNGLETLCRYGGRGALSLQRLSRGQDGRLSYRMKRPLPDGTTHLLLSPEALLRRLAALVPPPRQNLTRFHGVFGPHSRLRALIVPKPPPPTDDEVVPSENFCTPEKALESSEARQRKENVSGHRVPWADLLRRTFGEDLLHCPCGGKRRVLAHIVKATVVKRILQSLNLPSIPAPRASAQSPPQHAFSWN